MNQRKLAAAANILISVFSFNGICMSIRNSGLQMLQYYTVDSNILALAASVYCLYCGYKGEYKRGLLIKYISVCCVMVTFLVAAAVLAPMQRMPGSTYLASLLHFTTQGDFLYMHLLVPWISFLSFVMIDPAMNSSWSVTLKALLPTIIYGTVTVVLNLCNIMHGPYPFLMVHEQSLVMSILWIAVILLIAWAAAAAARLLNEHKER